MSKPFASPLPRYVTRPIALAVLVGWIATMGVLVHRTYVQAAPATLATDLAKYGPTAVWHGVYYRGEKIGFTVSQTTRTDHGFELEQEGRLQMPLLGQDTAAAIRTSARVDTDFMLRDFDFALDPGTGPVTVKGALEARSKSGAPYRLRLAITSGGATRTETRDLPDAPVMSLNLSRLLASRTFVPGSEHRWNVLDPATLQTAAMTVRIGERSIVRTGETSMPAFRVESEFQGLRTTSWVTDTGEVVREESALGLMTIRESAERARGLTVTDRVRGDLLRAAAVVPVMSDRIDEPRDVRRLRVQFEGATLPDGDLDGAGQSLSGGVIEIVDSQARKADGRDADLSRYLAAEPLIESDAPAIRAEAEQAVRGAEDDRVRAERLTRYVNGLLDKKPTVSLPSALEVLRTKVGDCNEHTALFVAMARAIGLPSRIDVGLVYMHGAFYYHAWPEVYLVEPGTSRGLWMPVDPTLNQFPADATHIRLARGGLDRQAVVLPLIGRLKMRVLDIELAPGTNRVIVGREPAAADLGALPIDLPRQASSSCRCSRSPR
ncbi:MAG TPA: transglutaminase-like domain-containing protein [Vicinamibacterales bacterium]|nr:transglutaminase-like domain-containing protein [Vicinamibacterales bacterium]